MHSQAVLSAVAIAGLVLGVLGCSLALWSWRRHRSLQSRLGRLEEAATAERERQAKRARLRATLEHQIEISWTLVIQNEAPATASGITISINGEPLDRSPLVSSEKLGKDGTKAIAGNDQLRLPLVMRERPDDLMVEITWSDASGDLGFSKMTFGG